MSDITFKCPSCGGYLTFEPDSGHWVCPYCKSVHTEEELREKERAQQQSAYAENGSQNVVTYHCPSCGSEIVTDETTVATHCYYCHNPVVLQGKMTHEMRPEKVLPFRFNKDEAIDKFMKWVGKKHYVPTGFFSREMVSAEMKGVYFPYFIWEAEVNGEASGTAKRVETIPSGDYIDTFTHHYQVERGGVLHFKNLMRPALSGIQRKITDGIQPFPLEEMKNFSGAFLSGFYAERRNMEASSFEKEVTDELGSYVQPLLTQNMAYTSTNLEVHANLTDYHTDYVLVPAWVLTYPNSEKPNEPYYYAMNGCTGEVCGRLPIVKRKLFFHAALISLGVMMAALALCYFLF